MSSPAPIPSDTADDAAPPTLAALRARLDRLDNALHDLLMQRAEVVTGVAGLAAQGSKVAFRPGREADILRRLAARHTGPLPARALPRLWRELFAATTAMQANVVISVCDTDPAGGLIACAREHFGALTPLRMHRSPAQAIAEVRSGGAIAAVLPLPAEDEASSAAWWTMLLHRDEPRVYVVARLPFWAPRPEGSPQAQALVVATAPPDVSSHDRTLLGFDLPPEMSRGRMQASFVAVGLPPSAMLIRRDAASQTACALIETEGHVTMNDPRLAALAEHGVRPMVLGAYAVPMEGDPA